MRISWLAEHMNQDQTAQREPACDFCGRPIAACRALVQGARASICDECVDLCVRTIADAVARQKAAGAASEAGEGG